MRTVLVAAVCLSVAACGGGDEAPTAAECGAVRQTIQLAADAYAIENGAPAPSLDIMVGDYVDPDAPTDWFAVTDGVVSPVKDGPCD